MKRRKYINRSTFKLLIHVLFLVLTSIGFSFDKNVVIEAKINNYVEKTANKENRFLHSYVKNDKNLAQKEFNDNGAAFYQSIRSDLRTFTSYFTVNKDEFSSFDLDNNYLNYRTSATIVYLPYRLDINRNYMESIRLRQYVTDIDSKFVANGFDFSFFISSIMADDIIKQSEGRISTYNEILDYNGNGLDFSINIDGTAKRGHVRNIFYIESNNEISMALDYFLSNFIIYWGSIESTFPNYYRVLNYDFLLTSTSIKNNLELLSSVDYGEVNLFDKPDVSPSVELSNIFNYQKSKSSNTILSIFFWFIAIISIAYFTLRLLSLIKVCSHKNIIELSILLLSVISVYILFKILSYFPPTAYISYLLSNYPFGIFSIFIVVISLIIFTTYFNKISVFLKFRNQKS